jgi:hypothetical protein
MTQADKISRVLPCIEYISFDSPALFSARNLILKGTSCTLEV